MIEGMAEGMTGGDVMFTVHAILTIGVAAGWFLTYVIMARDAKRARTSRELLEAKRTEDGARLDRIFQGWHESIDLLGEWEDRALKAEAEVERLKGQEAEVERLKGQLDHQVACRARDRVIAAEAGRWFSASDESMIAARVRTWRRFGMDCDAFAIDLCVGVANVGDDGIYGKPILISASKMITPSVVVGSPESMAWVVEHVLDDLAAQIAQRIVAPALGVVTEALTGGDQP